MIKINETELFKRNNILLLEKNKEDFEKLKELMSMHISMPVDSSSLVRTFIEYFSDNTKEFVKLKERVVKNKGFNILCSLYDEIATNKNVDSVHNKLGVEKDVIEKALILMEFKDDNELENCDDNKINKISEKLNIPKDKVKKIISEYKKKK